MSIGTPSNSVEDHPAGKQDSASLANTPWMAPALLVFFSGILAIQAAHFYPFLSDDSLISLRYASRLLQGHGLSWTDGVPVEGYSNLLWVLLVAFIGMFGIDLIDAARLLGIIGMATVIASIINTYVGKYSLRIIWFPLVLTLLFFSLSSPIAVWAIGGLEPPLYAALIAISIALMFSILENGRTARKLLALSFTLGLLCLTRPDGPIFALASLAPLLWTGLSREKRRFNPGSFLILVFPVLFYGMQLVFRLFYYGEFVPNIALVKINPSLEHALGGLRYLRNGLLSLVPFSFLAIAALLSMLFVPSTRSKSIFLTTMAILWSAYIVFIGGDSFPGYRHIIPLVVIFSFALVEGTILCARGLTNRRSPLAYRLVVATGFILTVPYIYAQMTHSQFQRAVDERWEWNGKELGLILKKAFALQQPLVAVTAAGCIPYWSELPSLDMLGLNDYYLARNQPKDIGDGPLAHELGDGAYVLRKAPDLIVFHIGWNPTSRSGYELRDMPEFQRLYIPTKLKLPHESYYSPVVYFHKYSLKSGIQYAPRKITIPGFFFVGENSFASLNGSNKLVIVLNKNESVGVTLDSETRRQWSVDVEGSGPDVISTELQQKKNSITVRLVSKSKNPVEIEQVALNMID